LSLLRYTPSREEMVNRQDFFRFDRLYFFHAQSREEKSQLPHDFLAAEGGGPIIRAPAGGAFANDNLIDGAELIRRDGSRKPFVRIESVSLSGAWEQISHFGSSREQNGARKRWRRLVGKGKNACSKRVWEPCSLN
jgi:hypothetical protein